ncbi:helix-turn-helix transcriptional regulator [Geodermatophilus normandii]|uniref:helix-turn-helix transcriptional regulator n=1 Tax=Geodermatophilus normandii TaxID=1137989 RepID=UPI000D70EB98|nr:helix-turn-helix transcriptional regulator [Geodermatophilus normandii]
MGTGSLREGDADALADLLRAARCEDPGPVLPWVLLEGLLRLVPCDLGVTYQAHDHRRRQSLLVQGVMDDGTRGVEEPGPTAPDDRFWHLWWSSICSWPQRTGDLASVIHTGDLYPTERARLADPMHAEVLTDSTAELMVSLPAPPGEARRLLFQRWSGGPFTERDRRLLELARPHVQELFLLAERRRAEVPRLTRREWEVLALAGAGLSTEDIAAALWISRGTVRKHAEHIRERCGTHTLAEAAARALPHAPVAVPRR